MSIDEKAIEKATAAIRAIMRGGLWGNDWARECAIASISTYLSAALPDPKSLPPYSFDRYVDGCLMAEGIEISIAVDLQDAIRKALQLCPKRDRTVLVSAAAPPDPRITAEARRASTIYKNLQEAHAALEEQNVRLVEAVGDFVRFKTKNSEYVWKKS